MTLPVFSGRTTCYEHKRDWKNHPPGSGKECIRDVKFFDVQWSNCPVEVEIEVKRMWTNWELGNDNYFINWDWDEMSADFPIVGEFLKSKGLTEDDTIIIHWWW